MMIQFSVQGSRITLLQKQPPLSGGSVGVVFAGFTFDAAWDGYTKTAVFCTDFGGRTVLLSGDTAELPAAVTAHGGELSVGVFGVCGDRKITTDLCTVFLANGVPTSPSVLPDPDEAVYTEILSRFTKLEHPTVTAVTGEDAAVTFSGDGDTASFAFTLPKGDKGDKGDDGAQGIQGAKGDKGDTGAQGIQGAKGDKGDKGDDGYTPVRGVDYFTAADKAEIVDDVLAALPAAESEEF